MLILIIIFSLIIFIYLIIYQKSTILKFSHDGENLEDFDNLNKIINYKVKEKQHNNSMSLNSHNIKEYEIINDNIMIHNKFKKELIDNINNKVIINNIIQEKQNEQKKILTENIEIDSIKYSIEVIKNKINSVSSDIKQLKLLAKSDINNLLNDIKNNNISRNEKVNIVTQLNKHIINNQNDILQFTTLIKNNQFTNKLNINYNNLIEKLLIVLKLKQNLLTKKLQIYKKIL